MSVKIMAVTGAASGIGAATVALFRERGDSVIALDRTPPPADQATADEHVFWASCDVTDSDSVAVALDAGIAQFTSTSDSVFAGVVHCAGVYLKSPSESVDLASWNRSIATNLSGSYAVAALAGQRLLQAGNPGTIVLLSSTAALLGDLAEPSAGYAASKGGVISLGRQLAVEWGGRGIRTNVVIPGVIDTPMTTIVNNPDSFSQVLSSIPVGRLGTAQEVAEVCVFLSSEKAGFVNGAAIPVDGGQSVN